MTENNDSTNNRNEKRFKLSEPHGAYLVDIEDDEIVGHWDNDDDKIIDLLNSLNEENEQLKKGMIGVVDRYIKNVDCNPPASTHTYMKIKGALLNIREDLRDLLEDLE